jgi:hypothetical protein
LKYTSAAAGVDSANATAKEENFIVIDFLPPRGKVLNVRGIKVGRKRKMLVL